MLSSVPQGCAKAGGSMCISSPQVESHSDVSMSQTRGSLSQKLGLPLGKSRHLPLCNPEQVPFSHPGRYPFLAYRNVRELACLKVSLGTSTEGSTAGLVLQSTRHFVTAPKAQFTQGHFPGALHPVHAKSSRRERLASLLRPGPPLEVCLMVTCSDHSDGSSSQHPPNASSLGLTLAFG